MWVVGFGWELRVTDSRKNYSSLYTDICICMICFYVNKTYIYIYTIQYSAILEIFTIHTSLLYMNDGRGNHRIKVIFSDESGQNLNLIIPTQYDGRSHVKSGEHFRFSKRSIYFEY